jgi:short-subunit dehydrogenase
MSTYLSEGTALITGASSGIGATYARRLAARRHDLILVARDLARLESAARTLSTEFGVRVDVLQADLADPQQRAKVEQRLRADERISVLVNNAGVGAPEQFVGADPAVLEQLLQVNVVAVMRLAAAALPGFKARGRGTLINIASVLALAPELFSGVYSGSKAFVVNFSQALNKELAGTGVHVQAVLPGATLTEIWARSGKDPNSLPKHMVMGVDALVDAALVGLERGEKVSIPPLQDESLWQAYQGAREALLPHLSTSSPAARYV